MPPCGFFARYPFSGREGIAELFFAPCGRFSFLPLPRLLILLLLLIAGIHPNPGPSSRRPIQYPCGSCQRNVGKGCRSVQCSACKLWLHLPCTSLSLPAFRALPRRHQWVCQRCSSSTMNLPSPTPSQPSFGYSSRFQPRVLLSRLPSPSPPPRVPPAAGIQQPRVLLHRLPPSSLPSPPSPPRSSPPPSNPPPPPPPAPSLSSSYPPSAFSLASPPSPPPSPPPLRSSTFRSPSSLNELKVLQWNANGVRARSLELTHFLSLNPFDVVVIQESKLQPSIRFRVPGYKCYRRDRSTAHSELSSAPQGGGVLTLVREGLAHSSWPLPTLTSSDPCSDFLGIRVHLRSTTISILNCYIPPSRLSLPSPLSRSFSPSSLPSSPTTFIFGDFNCHHPSWDLLGRPDALGSEVFSWTLSSDLQVLNDPDTPTLLHGSSGARTSPDLSLVPSSLAPRCDWSVLPDLGSDHLPISIRIPLSSHYAPNERSPSFNYKKAHWDVFQDRVSSLCPDPETYSSFSLSEAATSFSSVLLEAAKSSIPYGRTRQSPKAWWSPELDELVRERRKAYRKAHQSEEHRQAYLTASRSASSAIAKAKADAWQRTASNLQPHAQPRKVFSLLRSVSGAPKSSTSTPTFPGCRSDKDLATRYSTYLKSHFSRTPPKSRRHDTRSHLRELRTSSCSPSDHGSFCSPFSLSELTTSISNLSSSAAAGPDLIAYPLLQHLPPSAMSFLLFIFNLSWSTQSFPSAWKSSTIYPVHKSGKPTDAPSSFRPICLTSCISKLFERLVLARLSFLLESRNLLSPLQAGFRPGRSTTDQIVLLTQSISDGFHGSKPCARTVLATVDFSRAFDSVWHSALYHKLLASGLPSCFVRWTQSFLSDRRARVSYRGATSGSFRIRRGVPQGSVLGPVLFNLFINDLSSIFPSNVRFSLYADDLAIWASSPDIHQATATVQDALNRLESWSLQWQLPLNPAKCEVSFFSIDNHQASFQPNLSLLGNPLTFNPSPTFLGVTLDRTLSFFPHSSALRSSLYPRLRSLRAVSSASWGPSKESLASIYKAFLLPVLTYASPGWFPFIYAKYLQPLEAAHNSASRAITGCYATTPTSLLLLEAGLSPLSCTLTHQSLTYFERALRLPSSFPVSSLASLSVRKRVRSSSWRFFCQSHPLTPSPSSPVSPLSSPLPSLPGPLLPSLCLFPSVSPAPAPIPLFFDPL